MAFSKTLDYIGLNKQQCVRVEPLEEGARNMSLFAISIQLRGSQINLA